MGIVGYKPNCLIFKNLHFITLSQPNHPKIQKSRALAFQTGPEFLRVYQDRINYPELLLNSGLSPSFGHLFAPVTLTIAFKFIHFALRQLQNSP